jgi:hypothetical protein
LERKFGLFAFSATDIRGNAMRTEIVAAKHDEKSQKNWESPKRRFPKQLPLKKTLFFILLIS